MWKGLPVDDDALEPGELGAIGDLVVLVADVALEFDQVGVLAQVGAACGRGVFDREGAEARPVGHGGILEP